MDNIISQVQIKNSVAFPVYYEDTDFSGYVYHANYLNYFERGREHALGISYLKELYQSGFHFVVAKAELRYKFPAKHGDTVHVVTEAHLTSSPSVEFIQSAFLSRDGTVGRELVTGKIMLVAVNSEGRPTKIPNEVLERLTLTNDSVKIST